MAIEEDINTLQEEVERIKLQIKTDEIKDNWIHSKVRILYVSVTTYFIALVFMFGLDVQYPFFNALIPSLLYVLSFQTLPMVRRAWVRHYLEKEREEKQEIEEKQVEVAEIIEENAEESKKKRENE